VDAGAAITRVLGRPPVSRVARAILTRRTSAEAASCAGSAAPVA
jgi:histone H3/H4